MVNSIKELSKLLKLEQIIDVKSGTYSEKDRAVIDDMLEKEGE